ncbi:unnamed protein product [Bursaphelenchus okinawaensis]|uniref:GH16 domain-containing protein n=1 Tax=Bursaphelenchus okinawaensis TaxID=465554 RepID=A0A811LG75_9BILA|nr:unnamed protein product [Bursaphelenchus okinawaensis]CAG9121871.1 unnamed protein product [Bursaphelenchus okinawaensis]
MIPMTVKILLLCVAVVSAQNVIFEDNFDNIDGSKWLFEEGNGPGGWGNAELEYYTNRQENARIEDGHLVIEARREDYGGCAFTSARMITRGNFDFQYGTLEARIKIPNVQNGLWPAFWLLGAEGSTWPDQGEIDVLEYGSADSLNQGIGNRMLQGTFHWSNNGNQADYGKSKVMPNDMNDGFHTYKMEWNEQFIIMYVDDQEYVRIDITPLDVFKKRFYLILNLAVGGNYPNIHDPNAITAAPGQMWVDYIKVTQ